MHHARISAVLSAAVPLLLLGNLILGRLMAHGLASWPKTAGLGFLLVGSLAAFGPHARWGEGRRAVRSVMGYAWWCVLLGLSFVFARYSLLPRSMLPLLLLAAVAIHSSFAVPRLAGPAMAVLISLGLLKGADALVSRLMHPMTLDVEVPGLFRPDSLMGYRPPPNYRSRVVATQHGRLAYDVVYSIDEHGRRVTVNPDSSTAHDHVIFMGGSFVFGEGLEDEQTLPSQLAQRIEGVTAYNYGFPGYGAQHMYALLSTGSLPREIPERTGTLLFCLHDHYLDRAVGSYLTLLWGDGFPRYVVNSGVPVYTGSFAAALPVRAWAFGMLRQSPALHTAAVLMDPLVHRWCRLGVSTVRGLVIAADREYRRQFDGEFRVVQWPTRDPRIPGLARDLKAAGIPHLDLEALGLPLLDEHYRIPIDGHPNAAYYEKAAAIITEAVVTSRGPGSGLSPPLRAPTADG